MSMLEDIANYIETNGLGTYGTDLFIASEPETPNDCVTLYEYAGGPPDLQSGLKFPGLQVRARSTSWRTARAKLLAIENLLNAIGNEYEEALAGGVNIDGTFYAAIRATQGIVPLGEDENRRQRIVQSYSVMKAGG